MTYKEIGFRGLYHNFVAIELTDDLKPLIKGFPGEEEANGLLVYGYIDHEAGFTFEILATGTFIKECSGFTSATEGNDDIRAFIRAEKIEDYTIYNINPNEELLSGLFAKKLNILEAYEPSEDIYETRKMDFLDEARDPVYVDDVLVCFVKDGLKAESCWVRIESLSDHEINGILLNEPDQDFGCHEGDMVSFSVQRTEEGQFIPFTHIV